MRGKRLVLVSILSSAVLLSGCTQVELRGNIKDLEGEIEVLNNENQLLRDQIGGLTITEQGMQTSLQVVEGSAVPQFKYIDGNLVFPNLLKLPDSFEDVNSSAVKVGSMFSFKPSKNWVFRQDGTTLHTSHPSAIQGSIKSVGVKEVVPVELHKDIVQSFFNKFPSTNITYRKVFIDEYTTGLIAQAPIKVEGKDMMVVNGFANMGEFGVLFLFTYEDNGEGTQQELVDLLLSSGAYGDMSITLE